MGDALEPAISRAVSGNPQYDFTQRQLMSCLIVRAYLNTTYRGLTEELRSSTAGPTGERCDQWVKLSVIVLCTSLVPVEIELSLGPRNHRMQARFLLGQGHGNLKFYA